jgi:raffinose/stachyose/melibiose transport system permease protein
MALDVYNEAFISNNYGLGTAKALIFCIIVASFTIIQTSYTKKREVVA